MNGPRLRFLRLCLRSIELHLLNVDGVLTDGGLWFDTEEHLII